MKLRSFIAAFHAALLCILLAVTPAWSGSMTLLGVGKPAAGGGGGYVGPGDINGGTGGYPWYGLRAFSAAYATALGNAVGLVDQAGANPITIKVTAAGDLDVSAVSAWVTANSVTTIKVTTLYDQSGGTNHFVQATLALMPTLTLTGLGGKPVVSGNGSQQMQSTTTVSSFNTTTTSAVYQTSASPFFGRLMSFNNGQQLIVGNGGSANTLAAGFGTLAVTGVTDAVPHALQSLASTSLGVTAYIDGTNNTTASNTSATSGSLGIFQGPGGAQFMTGFIAEVGSWASDKTANNSTMNSNQHSYWGF